MWYKWHIRYIAHIHEQAMFHVWNAVNKAFCWAELPDSNFAKL